MKRIFQVLCGLLMTGMLLTSCLNSDDSTTTYYDDMAIMSFSLGTINRYSHTTTAAGKDSVYKTTYAGSVYKMNIDQLNHKIYNTDSLPIGTDAKHVLCTVTTRNNAVVYVKSLTSDTLTYFRSGQDSVDFTQPRLFRVFASDGSGSRDYLVTLNLRTQNAGRLLWTQMPNETKLPESWMNGWEFSLSDDHDAIASSNDHWATVINETLDTDPSLLPSANYSFACWEISKGLSYALLVGDSDGQEKAAVVWRKIIDPDKPTQWVYMPIDDTNRFYLPKGSRYWLLPFTDGSVFAISEAGTIYKSRDYGITWNTDSSQKLPVTTVAEAASAAGGILWLRGIDGTVWYSTMTD
jgi:hypothetical protein